MDLITSRIPDVTPLSNIAGEISFRLPFQSSAHFADVFDEFDQNKDKYGIDSYGISVTTLEEVFLRVGHEDDGTPEGFEARRKALKESQRKLSSEKEPTGQPQDIYDMPHHPTEVVVDGVNQPAGHMSNGHSTNSAVHQHSLAPPPESSIAHLESTNVKKDFDPPVKSDTSADPSKRPIMRRESSRFNKLRIPDQSTSMFYPHFRALFIKRLLNARRDRKVWTWTLVYPFLILLIGCGLITLTNVSSYPELAIARENLEQDTTPNRIPYVLQNGAATNIFQTPPALTAFDDRAASVPPGSGIEAMSQLLLSELDPIPRQPDSRYNAFYSDFRQDGGPNNYVDNFVVFFNTTCQWATALGLNLYNNQLLQELSPGTSIDLSIHPFPQTQNQKTLINSITAVIVAM